MRSKPPTVLQTLASRRCEHRALRFALLGMAAPFQIHYLCEGNRQEGEPQPRRAAASPPGSSIASVHERYFCAAWHARLSLPLIGPRRPWRSQAWRQDAHIPRFLICDFRGARRRFRLCRRPTRLLRSQSAGLLRDELFLDVSRTPNNRCAVVQPSNARLLIHPAWTLTV